MNNRLKTLLFRFPHIFEQNFLCTKIIYNNHRITQLNYYMKMNSDQSSGNPALAPASVKHRRETRSFFKLNVFQIFLCSAFLGSFCNVKIRN